MNSFILTFSRLIIRAFFLAVLSLIFLQLLGKLLNSKVPYYWASPIMHHKIQVINNDTSSINTFFFGSSYTINGVNPMVFDSLTVGKTSSYNLGVPFGVVPENLYWVDHFISNYEPKEVGSPTVFLELNEIHSLKKNVNVDRFHYMLNKTSFDILWEFIGTKNQSFSRKILHRKILMQAYLRSFCNFELLGNKIKYWFSGVEKASNDNIQTNKGYVPAFEVVGEKNRKYLKKTISKIERNRKSQEVNTSFFKDYADLLIKKAAEKNIRLVFLILPCNIEQYTWSLSQQFKDRHLIDLGSIDSVLFLPENRKNIGHLNDNGARIFTTLLAKECNRRKYFEY